MAKNVGIRKTGKASRKTQKEEPERASMLSISRIILWSLEFMAFSSI